MEEREKIINSIVWSNRRGPIGGQSVGVVSSEVTLTCDPLTFTISVGCFRTMLKNRELAYTLFELALDEYLKQWKK